MTTFKQAIFTAFLIITTPLARAAGQAIVHNYCGGTIKAFGSYTQTGALYACIIQPGASCSFNYANEVRVTVLPPSAGAPSSPPAHGDVFLELSLSQGTVFYNAATNDNNNPLPGGFKITGSSSSCPGLDCPNGKTGCFNLVGGHVQNQVKACSSANTLTFHACGG